MKRKYQTRPFLFDQDNDDDDPCFSVQGAWQESTIAPQEVELDKKMRREYQRRQELYLKKQSLIQQLDHVIEVIAVGSRRGVKTETLQKHRQHALSLRIELEELKNMKI